MNLLKPIALITVCIACSPQPPQLQVETARDQLRAAEAAGAHRYAPDRYLQTQSLLRDAVSEVASQEHKLRWFRSYDRALELLASVREAAFAAQAAADAARNQERGGAARSIDEAGARLGALHAALLEFQARDVKSSDTIERVLGELVERYIALDEARWAFRRGDFRTARSKAEVIGSDAARFHRSLFELGYHGPSSPKGATAPTSSG